MTDTINVTKLRPSPAKGEVARPKDRTAAERSRRYRKRKRAVHAVTPAVTVAPAVTVTPARHGAPVVTAVTLVAALALATVSAGFSITGMTSIFVGSFWPVIGMGVALETGKLSAVAWFGQHGQASLALKAALGILIAVLMGLNAIGAYGFLSKAHIEHAVAGEVAAANRDADVDARLSVRVGVLADIDHRIAQIDGAIEKATAKGRASSAMALADSQRKTRIDLVAQRTSEAKAIAALQIEKAAADGERRKVEADLGPVRYLATLLGATDQDVLRWFILIVALLLDPAAVLLLAAASAPRGRP